MLVLAIIVIVVVLVAVLHRIDTKYGRDKAAYDAKILECEDRIATLNRTSADAELKAILDSIPEAPVVLGAPASKDVATPIIGTNEPTLQVAPVEVVNMDAAIAAEIKMAAAPRVRNKRDRADKADRRHARAEKRRRRDQEILDEAWREGELVRRARLAGEPA